MELYLLRHGIAEARRPGRADEKRELTEKGRERLRAVLEVARNAGVNPSLILTSPYPRAAQSAEMAAEILGCKKVVRTEALLPGSSRETVWEEIRAYREETAILLAGHEPLLGQAASFLLGAAWVLVEMKKGALVAIDIDRFDGQPRGLLQWLLTAKLAAAGAR
ncbi:MAG: phosphohistidine phosphatase SixA [Bryobacteraceae bacterium]|jgi:phosphohistidine phosphatase